jgi:hypothetical protein
VAAADADAEDLLDLDEAFEDFPAWLTRIILPEDIYNTVNANATKKILFIPRILFK